MRTFYFLTILSIFLTFSSVNAQIPKTCGACKSCKNDCGPYNKVNERKNITEGKLKEKPFDGIIHIGVKRLLSSPNYSTASFISENMLITANHNVMGEGAITSIAFCLSTEKGDRWVTLKSKYFDIIHLYQPHDKWRDIALIKLKNTDFLKDYSFSIFELSDPASLHLENETLIHLTGFPCDRPDVLVEKNTPYENLLTDKTNRIIGYPTLFTCTGDSGAPLWVEKEGKYYIIGIHHGGDDLNPSAFPEVEDINVSVKISDMIIDWIKANQ